MLPQTPWIRSQSITSCSLHFAQTNICYSFEHFSGGGHSVTKKSCSSTQQNDGDQDGTLHQYFPNIFGICLFTTFRSGGGSENFLRWGKGGGEVGSGAEIETLKPHVQEQIFYDK